MEFFILNLFRSYEYKPKILKTKYLDNVFGAFLSQGIFLPFTSVFISAFGFGWKVKASFAIFFAIVERLFIKLNLFKNNWWRTLYTIVLIPMYFNLSDSWYKNLLKRNALILFTSWFLMTWVSGVSIFNIIAVLRNVRMGMGRFHKWKEHFILATLYWFIISIFTTWFIYKNSNWLGKIQSFMFMKLLDWVLEKKGIVKYHLYNSLFNTTLQVTLIFLTLKYKEWVYREQFNHNQI